MILPKITILAGTIVCLASCISIKAPDNLVSDTVNVSKEVYQNIRDWINEQQDGNKVIRHQVILQSNETSMQANQRCVDELKKSAQLELDFNLIKINSVDINFDGQTHMASCSLTLEKIYR